MPRQRFSESRPGGFGKRNNTFRNDCSVLSMIFLWLAKYFYEANISLFRENIKESHCTTLVADIVITNT